MRLLITDSGCAFTIEQRQLKNTCKVIDIEKFIAQFISFNLNKCSHYIDFLSNEAKGVKNIIGAETLDSFVEQLEKPRRILLMIQGDEEIRDKDSLMGLF